MAEPPYWSIWFPPEDVVRVDVSEVTCIPYEPRPEKQGGQNEQQSPKPPKSDEPAP